jgi:hypothetical protein
MNDSELEHTGVKGMKWGVRKQPEIGSDNLIIRKGTILNRVSTRPNEEHSGHAYATYKKKDSIGYMQRSMFFGKTFNMKMVVTKDLIAPSQKQRIDTFVELMRKDGTFSQSLAKAQAKQRIFGSEKRFQKEYDKLISTGKEAKAYKDFKITIGFNKELQKKYFDNLKKKGFNLTLDEADAGVLSESPIIVLDRKDSLKVVSVNPVTLSFIRDFKNS